MKNVLVVDNNPVLLKALSAILEKAGCAVHTACNGLEALEILQTQIPDIVFTDLVMPLVGGDQLCRIIRSTPQLAGICVVIVSAIVTEEKDHALQDLDYDLCIAKGNLKEMRRDVLEALQNCGQGDGCRNAGKIPPGKHVAKGLQPSTVTTELLSQKRHIDKIVNNLSEGVIELSRNGKIVSVNKAAMAILGCVREETIGRPIEEFPWGNHQERLAVWLREELTGGGMRIMEVEELEPLAINNRILTASLIPLREEQTVFGVCILRDISRQHHAEKKKRELDEALRLARQMDALRSMAGGFAHDFNNLLTVICGNLELLADNRDNVLQVDSGAVLANARRAASVAVDLVKKISCFSTFGIISRDMVQINVAVRAAVESYFRRHGGAYDLSCASGDNYVQFDSSQIETVIHNILQNAAEAAGEREIGIVLKDQYISTPTIVAGQYVPAGRYARVDISDQGPGLKHEELLRVFDPYYTTKQRGATKGLGLGLTIVYSTMRSHGGNVVVSSEPGEGTTVSLLFPVHSPATAGAGLSGKEPVEHARILLVEEDEQLREIVRIMLDYLGFPVTVAGNADAAIDLVTRGLNDGAVVFDAVILDMPGTGSEDVDLCRRFHDIDPGLKIIAASASISDTILEECRAYGCVNALPKPFSIDTLSHILSTLEGW